MYEAVMTPMPLQCTLITCMQYPTGFHQLLRVYTQGGDAPPLPPPLPHSATPDLTS